VVTPAVSTPPLWSHLQSVPLLSGNTHGLHPSSGRTLGNLTGGQLAALGTQARCGDRDGGQGGLPWEIEHAGGGKAHGVQEMANMQFPVILRWSALGVAAVHHADVD